MDVSQCSWSLDDDATDGGERCKVLSVSFIKPPMSEEDITYKKGSRGRWQPPPSRKNRLTPLLPLPAPGIRSDNRSREREGDMRKKGYRFFQDDEDVFALEDVLQVPPTF